MEKAIDFSDLETWGEEDLPALPNAAKIDPAAQLGMGVAKSKATVARFPCEACSGSGRWTPGPWSQRSWPCRKCRGAGLLKTDPKVLAKRREAVAAKKQADKDAFREANTDVFAWLKAACNNGRYANEFAESLMEAFGKYGSLTDGQVAAVRRNIERDTKRQAERAVKPADVALGGAGFARMLAAFAAARASGLKRPAFQVADYCFSPAKEGGTNSGCIYVKRGREYSAPYLGKITVDGGWFASRDATAEDKTKVAEICSDPLAAAVMHGKETGQCSCCNRTLENEESVQLGIGPICRRKWGL